MRWLSIDSAATSGIAVWRNEHLQYVGTLSEKKGGWLLSTLHDGASYVPVTIPLPDYKSALQRVILSGGLPDFAAAIFLEHGRGPFRKADAALNWRLGYITAVAQMLHVPRVEEVNPSQWRAALTKHHGVVWPRKTKANPDVPKDAMKTTALAFVRDFYDLELPATWHDAADAVCIGAAMLALGLIN